LRNRKGGNFKEKLLYLRAVRVRRRQVDLVEEEDEPLANLLGAHNEVTARATSDFAVLSEGFQKD
jgi:hypothetical protein